MPGFGVGLGRHLTSDSQHRPWQGLGLLQSDPFGRTAGGTFFLAARVAKDITRHPVVWSQSHVSAPSPCEERTVSQPPHDMAGRGGRPLCVQSVSHHPLTVVYPHQPRNGVQPTRTAVIGARRTPNELLGQNDGRHGKWAPRLPEEYVRQPQDYPSNVVLEAKTKRGRKHTSHIITTPHQITHTSLNPSQPTPRPVVRCSAHLTQDRNFPCLTSCSAALRFLARWRLKARVHGCADSRHHTPSLVPSEPRYSFDFVWSGR